MWGAALGNLRRVEMVAVDPDDADDEGRPSRAGRFRRRQFNVAGGRAVRRRVQLTPDQDRELTSRADAAGVTVPRYLVDAALHARPDSGRILAITGLFELTQEVARVGNNLNQVARVANSTKHMPVDAGPVVDQVHELLSRLDGLAQNLEGGGGAEEIYDDTIAAASHEWEDRVRGPRS